MKIAPCWKGSALRVSKRPRESRGRRPGEFFFDVYRETIAATEQGQRQTPVRIKHRFASEYDESKSIRRDSDL